jgi:metal-responsive CopG/Arc/MetJ family transcriptional regulator
MDRFNNVDRSELIRKFIEEVIARYEVEEDLKSFPEPLLGIIS